MSTIIVGIADCRCTSDPAQRLVTYALGSCIAVGMYDPEIRAGGILHFMLPDSRMDPGKAERNPAMFADTGIPLLVNSMEQLRADRRRLRVRLAGGAQIVDKQEVFNIGKRNYMAARKALWQLAILLEMEAVGGDSSRNLSLNIGNGEFVVQTQEPGRAPLRDLGKSKCAKP